MVLDLFPKPSSHMTKSGVTYGANQGLAGYTSLISRQSSLDCRLYYRRSLQSSVNCVFSQQRQLKFNTEDIIADCNMAH